MFQIEPVLWLQSFDSPVVAWLFSAVTFLGYTAAYVALVIGLAFGVRLRPSLLALITLLLAGIATDALKNGFALPRPSDVDVRAAWVERGGAAPLVDRGAGGSFWALPDPAAVAAVRALPEVSYGLPSGHVGSATAFFLALALFFRAQRVLLFAAGWIPLMALSRMYLGRHFLADVLGGVVVGLLAVGVAALLLRPLHRAERSAAGLRPLALLAAVGLALLVLTPFEPLLDAENVGRLLGVVTALGLVLVRGFPADGGPVGQRAARVVTAVVLYLASSRGFGALLAAAGWEDRRAGALAAGFLITGVTLAGTVELCRRFGWYVAADDLGTGDHPGGGARVP